MSIRKSFQKWQSYSRTVRELNSLDSRSLNDLGINRGDIDRIARESANSI